MNDDKHQKLIQQLEEDGLLQVRNDFEEGKYGKNNASPEYKIVEAWMDKQHRQQIDNAMAMKEEPKRLMAFVALVIAFIGLLYYIFAY